MYRDDLAATYARVEQLQRELRSATGQAQADRQRIAQLTAQIESMQQALRRAHQPYLVPPQQSYVFAPRGTAVLTLGILSLVVCSILGPIAWAMGNEELRRMDSGQTPGDDRGSVTAGRICGIISSTFLIITAFFILMVVATAGH